MRIFSVELFVSAHTIAASTPTREKFYKDSQAKNENFFLHIFCMFLFILINHNENRIKLINFELNFDHVGVLWVHLRAFFNIK